MKQESIDNNKISTEDKKRESGIELLRIILMIMIICFHCSSFNLKDYFIYNKSIFFTKLLFSSACLMAVDCFVFISGYYGLKFRLKQVASLTLQAVFYSYICFIGLKIVNPSVIDQDLFFKHLLPVSSSLWWYLTTYILLYFMSPFLNAGIDKLSKRQFQILLIGFLYLNCFSNFIFNLETGGHILNFVFIYLLARYMKIYSFVIKKPLLIYLITVCAIFGLNAIASLVLDKGIITMGRYSSIFAVIAAASLFFLFKKISFNKSFIFKISPLCLGIYLLHFNSFSWNEVIAPVLYAIEYFSLFYDSILMYVALILFLSILVFTVCAFVEKLRQIVCEPLLNLINKQINKYKLS